MNRITIIALLAAIPFLVGACGEGSTAHGSEPTKTEPPKATGYNNPQTLAGAIDENTESNVERKEAVCVPEGGEHHFECSFDAREKGSAGEWSTSTAYVTVAPDGESWVSR